MYKILLATDGSEHSLKMIGKATKMIRLLNANLTVLTVVEDVPVFKGLGGLSARETATLHTSMEQVAQEGLQNAKQVLAEHGIEASTMLRKGQPAEVICKVAEEGHYDMVVLGDTGFGGLKELFLGSVSNKVAHKVKTDVFIVKWKHE